MNYAEWYAAPREADWLAVRWVRLRSGKVKRETLRVATADCWEPQARMAAVTLPADAADVLGDHPILMETGRCLDGCCDVTGKTRRADVEARWRSAG